MEKFIIFYATPKRYDHVSIYAETFDEACETSQAFARVHSVTILGVIEQSYYKSLNS